LKVKVSDSRSAFFKRQYGNHRVELDTLPPTELRRRIKEAVEVLINWDAWKRALAIEQAESPARPDRDGAFESASTG
jgi:hypothetical protein